MVLEVVADGLHKDIIEHALLEDLLHLPLTPSLQNRRLLLEQETHTVQRDDLQRLPPDDPVQQQVELLQTHIPDKTVEHPREHDPQRLHLQLLKLGHDLLLTAPQHLLEQHAQT